MSKQDRGGHSRESETNEDEKPLKKARYVWEVKGKKHLKEAYKNNNNNNGGGETSENNNEVAKTCETGKNAGKDHTECLKPDQPICYCINPYLIRIDSIMDDLDLELPINKTAAQGNSSGPSNSSGSSSSDHNNVPSIGNTRDNMSEQKMQDYYLQRWQARQIARGFVDNTINSVLESWGSPSFESVDLTLRSDIQVEDDAILMAIRSHGLQSSRGSSQSATTRRPETSSVDGLEQFSQDNVENYHKERKHQENPSDSMSRDSSDCRNANNAKAEDPMDFLDAAVSVAIKKKGLSYGF